MKNRKIISCIIISFFSVVAFSQQNKIDSLQSLIEKDKADTNKVVHLNELSWEYKNNGNYDTALYFGNTALLLSQKINFQKGIANSYNRMGNVHDLKGDYQEALGYYFKALEMDEELKDKNGISSRLNNIGIVYRRQADYTNALDYYFKALKIGEELGDKNRTAIILGNIGLIYFYQTDYPKAHNYYVKALQIDEEFGNKNGISRHLANIGMVYKEQSNIAKAIEYYLKALKMAEELGDKSLQATTLCNIGSIYNSKLEYPMALNYYFKALEMDKELGAKNSLVVTLSNIGTVYTQIGKFKESEQYLKMAITIGDSIGALNELRQTEELLSQLYDNTGQYQLALIHFKKSIAIKDTLFSQENKKQLVRKEMNFEFEKKEAVTKAIAEGEARKQKIVTGSVAGGLLLSLVFAGFIFRNLRVTKKQKVVIEQQKQLVEEHQKEIISSITYAKRLQEAILPPIHSIKKQFPESFILYNPKDVVAGDFYWMETIDNIQFIAAADCTGHGVPGAMMSVVCSNALYRAVKEFGLRDTGLILDKVTDLVLETFEKSDADVKDGMDISLLRVELSNGAGPGSIQWSGANNPLWYIQNGKMLEIKADKQPIGRCDHRKPFTAQNIEYSENSIFYLFTDGYADQFGGPKGKKFMYRKFQENITALSSLSMQEQENALQTEFQGWKGSLEQVDDVTVIGVRV